MSFEGLSLFLLNLFGFCLLAYLPGSNLILHCFLWNTHEAFEKASLSALLRKLITTTLGPALTQLTLLFYFNHFIFQYLFSISFETYRTVSSIVLLT